MSMEAIYDKPGHLFRRIQQIAVAIFVDECADFDLTPPQYASLTGIAENPGIDATRLSSVIFFDRATLGNVLERLETKGYIYRTSRPGDKRVKVLNLTDLGRKLLQDVEPAVRRAQARMLEHLEAGEGEQLLGLLHKVIDAEDQAMAKAMEEEEERARQASAANGRRRRGGARS